MQNIYCIKLVITKVFITVIIICGMICISAILQNVKVRVNFETRHQNFVRNGFSTKNSYLGVKVIDFFHPQWFTSKKRKQSKLKNLIMRAFSYMWGGKNMGQSKRHWFALSNHTNKWVRYLQNFLSNIFIATLTIIWHYLNLGL